MDDFEGLDWSAIDLSGLPKKPRIQTGELSPYDYARLVVVSKLIRKSLSSTTQTALLTYLQRNWADNLNRLATEAKIKGVSPEQLFQQYLDE